MPIAPVQIRRSLRLLIPAAVHIGFGMFVGTLVVAGVFPMGIAATLILGLPFGLAAFALLWMGVQMLPLWVIRADAETRTVRIGIRRSHGRMATLGALPSYTFSHVRRSATRPMLGGRGAEFVSLDRGLFSLLVAFEEDTSDSMIQVARRLSSILLLPIRENRS